MEIQYWQHPQTGTCHLVESFEEDFSGKLDEVIVQTECGMEYSTSGIYRFDPTKDRFEQTHYDESHRYCGRCDWSDVEEAKSE